MKSWRERSLTRCNQFAKFSWLKNRQVIAAYAAEISFTNRNLIFLLIKVIQTVMFSTIIIIIIIIVIIIIIIIIIIY